MVGEDRSRSGALRSVLCRRTGLNCRVVPAQTGSFEARNLLVSIPAPGGLANADSRGRRYEEGSALVVANSAAKRTAMLFGDTSGLAMWYPAAKA